MSTKISTIMDNVRSAISSALPSHNEMVDPYEVDLTDELTLQNSWGIAYRSANLSSGSVINCEYTVDQNIEVVLTRVMSTGQLQISDAINERISTEKDLYEDRHTIIKTFETSADLNAGDLAICLYQGDSGIEFVFNDKTYIIMLRLNFLIKYAQNINL